MLIEPQRPALLLAVIGDAPAARKLRELAGVLGWRTTADIEGAEVVVASMGRDDEASARPRASGAGYVGLVASAKRAGAVTAELQRGVDEEALRGSAVRRASISARRRRKDRRRDPRRAGRVASHTRPSPAELVEEAIDPICGMTVAVAGAGRRLSATA